MVSSNSSRESKPQKLFLVKMKYEFKNTVPTSVSNKHQRRIKMAKKNNTAKSKRNEAGELLILKLTNNQYYNNWY